MRSWTSSGLNAVAGVARVVFLVLGEQIEQVLRKRVPVEVLEQLRGQVRDRHGDVVEQQGCFRRVLHDCFVGAQTVEDLDGAHQRTFKRLGPLHRLFAVEGGADQVLDVCLAQG
jgi:hypothetical protein